MGLSNCEYLFSPFHAAIQCVRISVCVCMLVSESRPSISDSPICGQQPCLLITRPESSGSLSTGKQAPSAQDKLGGAGGGEGGAVGFCLHPGINHSLHRQQTSTPFAPLTPSNRRSEVILFSYPLSFATFSLRFNLLIFPKQSLSPPLLIFSPSPHVVTPFAIFLSQTSYTFSSLCHCLVIFPKQSFPLPQSLSFIHSPFSHRLPSQVVSLIWSKHLSKPSPLLPSICFASSSALTLITHHHQIFSAMFCLSVSIGGQGTAGMELMG